MDIDQFNALAVAHNIRGETLRACRMVLVDGLSGYQAAKTTGIQRSTVKRALERMARDVCECCGKPR